MSSFIDNTDVGVYNEGVFNRRGGDMQKLVLLDIMGKEFTIEAEIISERTHGYDWPSGSWGLYPNKDGTSTPAKFTTFRKKHKRRHSVINNNRLVRVL